MELKYNEALVEQEFFEDTALIGIQCSEPAYRLCWLINEYFDYKFLCEAEMSSALCVKDNVAIKGNKSKKSKKPDVTYYMPVFQYLIPNCSFRHLLYKLKAEVVVEVLDLFNDQKNNKPSLLPEIIEYDYVWLVQTSSYEQDAAKIVEGLKNIKEISSVVSFELDELSNLKNLIL